MFISLTASDNGQALDIRADQVQAVQLLDSTNTMVHVAGVDQPFVVRESRLRILETVATIVGETW